jgi:hypothetical protein
MIHVKASKVILYPWITLVFLLKGKGSSHMTSWAHKDANRCAMVKRSTHTHSTSTRDLPHKRGWAHMAKRGRPPPLLVDRPPWCTHRLQACKHMPKLCEPLILWWFDPKAMVERHTDRWCGAGVAPTPPPPINRGSHAPSTTHAFKLKWRVV